MKCALCATPVPDNSRYCLACGADISGDSDEQTQRIEEDPELVTLLQADLHGEYIIEELLERGGMGAVFLARDAQLGRRVAIKVLLPDSNQGPGAVARFKREARTAAALDHPHIVPIHRISTTGRLFWYVMKYVDGDSLAQILERDGALPPPRAANLLSQIAEALDFAHKKGVVHRDIKPDNIMVDGRGWVTVMDFGIAKPVDRPGLTGPGATIGTPYYMSPEQCTGAQITPAADQYSLAVLAYRMVTDGLPFKGETILEIVRAHVSDPIPPLPATVPRPLAEVVERGMAKKPEERYAGVLEFADAFAWAARRDHKEGERRAGAPRIRPGARTPEASRTLLGRVLGQVRRARAVRIGGTAAAGAALLWLGLTIAPRPGPARNPADSTPPHPRVLITTPPADSNRPALRGAAPAPRAYLTVGSVPFARMTVNGAATPGNPVANFPVMAGPVRIHFQLPDSLGGWSFDTTVTLRGGQRVNLGRIRLTRRP
ncbi:MAG TPA: protein kinase [Gemmatimonadales bacterium]|nr:protein kinase [Gemmatimonadales bacterium]